MKVTNKRMLAARKVNKNHCSDAIPIVDNNLLRTPKEDFFSISTKTGNIKLLSKPIDASSYELNDSINRLAKKEEKALLQGGINWHLIESLPNRTAILKCAINNGIADPVIDNALKKRIINGSSLVSFDEIEKLAQIDHSAQNTSYSLHSQSHEYTKLIKETDPKDNPFNQFLANLHTSVLREIAKTPSNNKIDGSYVQGFKQEMELDPLKSYLINYSIYDKELSKYLYEKYYLSHLPKEMMMACQKISDEFGTKVFTNDETRIDFIENIHNELAEWQKHSNSRFITPSVINITPFNPYCIKNPEAAAHCNRVKKNIHISNEFLIKYTIRHEITHLNHPTLCGNALKETHFDKIQNNKLYKNEFLNAGLTTEEADYAYKDIEEFIAMAAEGDYSRYSTAFKKLLIEKFKMPSYIFEMKPLAR